MESTSRDEILSSAPVAPPSTSASTPEPATQQQQQHHMPPTKQLSDPPAIATASSAGEVIENSPPVVPSMAATNAPPARQDAPATDAPPEPEPELKAPSPPPQIVPTINTLSVTILVQSGIRHKFELDQSYLERHMVKSSAGKEILTDPLDMSVWQLKECIWKDWREDWDQRPASALFIRLIQFGAYLQDSSPLKDCRLNIDSSNVIHMAIRPAEVGDDDMTQRSTKGAFGQTRDREGTGGSPTCRCVIL